MYCIHLSQHVRGKKSESPIRQLADTPYAPERRSVFALRIAVEILFMITLRRENKKIETESLTRSASWRSG